MSIANIYKIMMSQKTRLRTDLTPVYFSAIRA